MKRERGFCNKTVRWIATFCVCAAVCWGASAARAQPVEGDVLDDAPIREMIASFYRDVLGRTGSQTEIDSWTDGYFLYAVQFDIDVRFIPREMARVFFLSPEYAARLRTDAQFITDCYRVFLRRSPSDPELGDWLAGEWNREQVLAGFSESEEFAERIEAMYPGLPGASSRNVVTRMYVGLLDRLVDVGGLHARTLNVRKAFHESGLPGVRDQMLHESLGIVMSPEFADGAEGNEDFVFRAYRCFLGRFPADTELNYWLGELAAGRVLREELLAQFAYSEEYWQTLLSVFDSAKTVEVPLPGDGSMALVNVPADAFLMGSQADERSRDADEGPVHAVEFSSSFYLGRTEVTQAQWFDVMERWPADQNESEYAPTFERGLGDDFPVYHVSVEEGAAFAERLNVEVNLSSANEFLEGIGVSGFRLPSEAEWEFACAGGADTRFYFGDSLEGDDIDDDAVIEDSWRRRSDYMWFLGAGGAVGAWPVGLTVPNAYGLYDMSGNVAEVVLDDYHANYYGAPTDGSAWGAGATSSMDVSRGGAWDSPVSDCRTAARLRFPAGEGLYRNGLRVAADVRPTEIHVDVTPDSGSWTLTGPHGFERAQVGDARIQYLDPGVYTLVCHENIQGYAPPSPQDFDVRSGESTYGSALWTMTFSR